jgi:hypothetical protein
MCQPPKSAVLILPDDWIAGTVGLTHDERSVYISVCVAIWSCGGRWQGNT